MKRLFLLIALFTLIFGTSLVKAQSIGFSYMIPTNGYFSNPIAPVHFSMPIKFGKFIQISPGIGMHNIGGMSMTGFPDELNSSRALVGPFQSLNMSLIPAIVIPTKSFEVELQGGVFGFAAFNQKVMKGNFEDMISEAYNYTTLSSDPDIDKSSFGWGYVLGTKFNFKVKSNIWGFIGFKYYMGEQAFGIRSDLSYTIDNGAVQTRTVDYADSKVMYHGFEISIGGTMRK